ncbi:hypothetical protein RJ641_020011, partial [Dillenia turbinata]
ICIDYVTGGEGQNDGSAFSALRFLLSGNIFVMHPGAESYKQPPSNASDTPLLIAPVESITYLQRVSLLFVVQLQHKEMPHNPFQEASLHEETRATMHQHEPKAERDNAAHYDLALALKDMH